MESAIGSCAPTMGLMNLKMIGHKWSRGMQPQLQFYYRLPSSAYLMVGKESPKRSNYKVCSALQAVSPVQYTENPEQTSLCFEDFHVSVCAKEDRVIKICVNASSAMTESIFEKVFAKHVAAAQPLPGFRRMKGGKTPDIPKDVLLHLIGPSKVKKETIKKIINCTVAEYLQKEGLNASKNLKVQQSYEELEAAFELGKEFCFDAVVHLQ